MAFHSLSKPQVAATVDSTAAQGHSHYWREGKDVKQAEGKIYILQATQEFREVLHGKVVQF